MNKRYIRLRRSVINWTRFKLFDERCAQHLQRDFRLSRGGGVEQKGVYAPILFWDARWPKLFPESPHNVVVGYDYTIRIGDEARSNDRRKQWSCILWVRGHVLWAEGDD